MRIPKNISLKDYIVSLIDSDNLEEFYNSDDWKELREFVLNQEHYECVECRELGKVKKANCVHHDRHVRDYPELALSMYYTDAKGNRKKNLIPLCNKHHNQAHPEKMAKHYNNNKPFMNEERW